MPGEEAGAAEAWMRAAPQRRMGMSMTNAGQPATRAARITVPPPAALERVGKMYEELLAGIALFRDLPRR
jgi:hypothetical protein